MRTHVIPVSWESHGQILEELRARVFIEEQGVAADIERDGQDADAHHFLALTEAGQHVGCARLLPTGQIGRMAVLPEHRHQGIGFELLSLAVDHAKSLEFTELFLNAQTHAEAFYRRAGFMPVGGEFMEAGIPHQRMELVLPIPFESSGDIARPVVREESVHPDAEAADLLTHKGEAECIAGLAGVLDHPSREVRIYSPLLDHNLFEDDAVVEALSAFARGGPPATLNVLIHSSSLVVSRGHRLLNLARRLASKIAIRLVPDELQDEHRCFVLADHQAFFLLPDHQEYVGFSNRYDPVQATQLADRFDFLWQRAERDPELRALSL